MRARVAVVAVVFLGVLAGESWAQNQTNPIPGIDVVVRKKPAGNAMKVTTDKSGAFVLANLEAGQYTVSVVPPQLKAPINTSRSNIKRPSVRVDGKANTVAVGFVVLPGDAVETEVTVSSAGGKITGMVVRDEATLEKADAKKESGAKR